MFKNLFFFFSFVAAHPAETESEVGGKRRRSAGQRAPQGPAGHAATPPSGAGTARRRAATGTGSGIERRLMMKKMRTSC